MLIQNTHKKEKAGSMTVSLDGREICCDVFRSSRRRTMELSLYEGGRVRTVVPSWVTETEIRRFIQDKAGWLARRLAESGERQRYLEGRRYETGHEFLFLGKPYVLSVRPCSPGKRPGIGFDEGGWTALVPPGRSPDEQARDVKRRLIGWYKDQARELFGVRVFHYGRQMSLDPLEVCVRWQRSIWGSCVLRKRLINLNGMLVMAPLGVIDYVIVHELAHLRHPNHSSRFWQVVAEFIPDYRGFEDWLKHHRWEMLLP